MNAPIISSDMAAEAKPQTNPFVDLIKFGTMLGALLAAAFLTIFAIVWLIPDGNDYALATNLKHERLENSPGRRLVLVGGSNLAFGIDSDLIEAETDFTPVNMGMNGFFGVRYMLEEVRHDVRAGDVVVIAFEWDNYVKTIEGANSDLLMILKANPAAFRYFGWKQRVRVLFSGAPYVAQQKVMRVVNEALRGSQHDESYDVVARVERLSGFNAAGDLTSHLGVAWPYPRSEGLDLTELGIDAAVVGRIQDFAREMAERDVTVVVSYTPVMASFYREHAALIDEVHRRINEGAPGLAPRHPRDYVYEEPLFFDTVYHLNAEGRGPRTRQLIGDVDTVLARDVQ